MPSRFLPWGVAAVMLAAACGRRADSSGRAALLAGDPAHGREAVVHYSCGSCHEIPGVAGAHGRLGPPLGRFAGQSIIAGRLANTSANLIRWLRDPPAIAPGTVMPDLGIDSMTAGDITAYLYSLR